MARWIGALPDGVDIAVDAGNTGAAADSLATGAPRGPVPGRPRHGRHGLQLRRRHRDGVRRAEGSTAGAGRAVVIAGDGAFFMHGMEIHTAVHYRLPVTFVLLNNNAHAMCVTREQLFYSDWYSYNRFRPAGSGRVWPRCSPSWRRSTSATRRDWPRRCAPRWTSTVRRWSASNAQPTKSRPLRHFSVHVTKSTLINIFHSHRRTTPMSLSALDDIVTHTGTTEPIDGVVRIETPAEKTAATFIEAALGVPARGSVRPVLHGQRLRRLPADELFEYLSDTRSLKEWTYTPARLHPDATSPDCGRPTTGCCRTPTIYTRTSPTTQPARSTTTVPGTRASTYG